MTTAMRTMVIPTNACPAASSNRASVPSPLTDTSAPVNPAAHDGRRGVGGEDDPG